MTSTKALARTAGLLYLALIALMGFANMVVRDSVYVRDNAAATADKIRESAGLYRMALASDLIGNVCYLFLALALYFLLRSHGQWAARTYLTPAFDESSVMALLLPGGIAEIVFALWLTIRGANAPAQVADNDPHVGRWLAAA